MYGEVLPGLRGGCDGSLEMAEVVGLEGVVVAGVGLTLATYQRRPFQPNGLLKTP